MNQSRRELKELCALIKKRFPNLTVEEVVDLVSQILDIVDEIRGEPL